MILCSSYFPVLLPYVPIELSYLDNDSVHLLFIITATDIIFYI